MTQNGLKMIKISHFKIQQQFNPEITLAVAKINFLPQTKPPLAFLRSPLDSPRNSLEVSLLNHLIWIKMKEQSKVEVEGKKWTKFVLNSGNFQISTPLPRGIAWLCHVTTASKFYNPSNLTFDVSDSFGVGKIQTLYGIWLETIFRTQRWRRNFHLEIASMKSGSHTQYRFEPDSTIAI